jgi:pyroglutamyl-peptidase
MPCQVLLTGFLPFGDAQSNPSQQIAEVLDGQTIGGARVTSLVLPVVFRQDTERVPAAIAELCPALVLSLGLAAGAPCLEVERFAVNLRIAEAWLPHQPLVPNRPQAAIVDSGPEAYFATKDTERVACAIRDRAQAPARAHGYAGAYLCNHLLYQARHFLQTRGMTGQCGFIHLPLSCEQAVAENKVHLPSLPLELMTQAIRIAIETAVEEVLL